MIDDKIYKEIKILIKHELINKKKDEKKVCCNISNKNLIRFFKRKIKRLDVWSDEKCVEFQLVKNKIFDKNINSVKDAFVEIFKDQQKDILSQLKKELGKKEIIIKATVADKIKLGKKWNNTVLNITIPIFEEIFKQSVKETNEFIGTDVPEESVNNTLNDDLEFMISGVNDTTNAEIGNQLKEGFSLGEGVKDLTDRIQSVFGNATKNRAEMIARTETVRFSEQATEQVYIESGIVEAKKWQVDGNPCPRCIAMQGKIVPLGNSYITKGGNDPLGNVINYGDVNFPPLHPNCLCVLVPVFKEKNEIEKTDDEIFYDFFDENGSLREMISPYKNLSQSETIAIQMYSEQDYIIVNNYLRFGRISSRMNEVKTKQLIKIINRGVNKLEEIKGTFFRGLSIGHKNLFEKGKIYSDKGFLSTSSDISVARTFGREFKEKIILEIKGNATPISEISNLKQEKEFLFKNNKKFKVISVDDFYFDDMPDLKNIKVTLEEIKDNTKSISENMKFMVALQNGEKEHKKALIKLSKANG